MTAVSIHVDKQMLNAPRFRAMLGNRQSVGRTMGKALDALTADWDDTVQEADVRIEPLRIAEAEEEPRLIEINGVWVITGGDIPDSDMAKRDFVAEMREALDRSFYINLLPEANPDESPA
jgi:hypothetical protein